MRDYRDLFRSFSESYAVRGIRGLKYFQKRNVGDSEERFRRALLKVVERQNSLGPNARIFGSLPEGLYLEAMLAMVEDVE